MTNSGSRGKLTAGGGTKGAGVVVVWLGATIGAAFDVPGATSGASVMTGRAPNGSRRNSMVCGAGVVFRDAVNSGMSVMAGLVVTVSRRISMGFCAAGAALGVHGADD